MAIHNGVSKISGKCWLKEVERGLLYDHNSYPAGERNIHHYKNMPIQRLFSAGKIEFF